MCGPFNLKQKASKLHFKEFRKENNKLKHSMQKEIKAGSEMKNPTNKTSFFILISTVEKLNEKGNIIIIKNFVICMEQYLQLLAALAKQAGTDTQRA